MSLADLIYPKRRKAAANANPGNAANPEPVVATAGTNISKISDFSVSRSPEAEAANDPTTALDVDDDCAGFLQFSSGGSVQWAADAAPVVGSKAALRDELAKLSARVADAMHWDDDERAWLMEYAYRCPADNLAADVRAYRAQVAAIDAEQAARDAIRRARDRTWTAGNDLRNRSGE